MRIKKLILRNGYKRFHELTIDLGENPKKLVALVGPNGCGKSSVLDAMLFLDSSWGKIGNKSKKDYSYHSMYGESTYNYQNIDIEFLNGDFTTVKSEFSKNQKTNTLFSFRSPYRYNSNLKVTESKAVSEISLNNYGATSSSDLDDKMEDNYRRLNIKYNKYLNDQDCKPSEAKSIIIGELNSSLKNCLDLEITSIGDIDSKKGSLYFIKPDNKIPFEFNVLSSGEKEVVDILLDLYLRREEYYDTIFLIDEPELHVNSAIQRKLLLEINKLIGDNCQIWITTHSIGFLRALQEELKDDCQVIQFKKNTPWGSSTQILTPIKNSRAKWQEIFETALDDLTGLVSPKRIIYCEGKDRPGLGGLEKGFDAKVYNEIFTDKYHDTLFISSGGNTELDQRSEIAIAILTKVFADIEILVLKDRDNSSGNFTSEADRQTYLKNNSDFHRMLNRWEIENYLFDKEVLKKYCASDENLNFDEQTYDNLIQNIISDNVKDSTDRIKKICGITTSINPEKFKLNLAEFITEDMNIYAELESCIFYKK